MAEPLLTRSAQDLMTDPMLDASMLIDEIMGSGLGLICAAPKVGKSWLALDIAIQVAEGNPFWGYGVRQGAVLYLALEDTFQRITRRLWKLKDCVDGVLEFVTRSDVLQGGLIEQLEGFKNAHPDLSLVIIDTLQMVRTQTRDCSYSGEYHDLSVLKRFADESGATVLLIHHTRKMVDPENVMNNVSGTNALVGASDFAWLITREARGNRATVSIIGRDVEQRVIEAQFTEYRWVKTADEPLDVYEDPVVPECVVEVASFAKRRGSWEGSTSDLMAVAKIGDMRTSVFGKLLAQHSGYLASEGVLYSKRHTKSGTVVSLSAENAGDSGDGCDGNQDDPETPVTAVTPVTLFDLMEY